MEAAENVVVGASTAAISTPTELAVEGMTCGNCARHVAEAARSVPGVAYATTNLESARAAIRWSADAIPDIPAVVTAIANAGYSARLIETRTTAPVSSAGAARVWARNVLLGIVPTLILMAGEWVFGWYHQQWFRWFSFGLALIVQTVPGAHFYRGAWRQLKSGSSNMDTLVSLGSTTAFIYSVWVLFSGTPGHLYFMEAAAIITLISLGHWVEARVSARASAALQALLQLAPTVARKRNPDGTEIEVPVSQLAPGDQVVLRPGDRVPTDGQVIEGASAVDESMLTGESAPVEKEISDQLYAGTTNLDGRVLQKVTATGEGTALAHIISVVERAQSSRASIQRLGDRVSAVFVPVVVLIAVATGLWWGVAPETANRVHAALAPYLWTAHPPVGALAAGFIIAASVLIIACPCAMGLATPAAIMAGSNAAAKRGILIRDGVALEKAGTITAVLFDKTGTLTAGKPSVVGVEVLAQENIDEVQVKSAAAALARSSRHPLSQAVARLSSHDQSWSEWQEIRGAGILGTLGTDVPVYRLGSLKWLDESGVDVASVSARALEWSGQGITTLGFSQGPRLTAVFGIKDEVKPGARKVVDLLRAQGMTPYLVTGDNSRTATGIARLTGIPASNVFAEVSPERKAELVGRLQQEGHKVAFVGDGINDAPALEQADLGIAVARASDVTREAADMILLKSEIEAVPESFGLARATLRTIRQNLFWAFCYNALGVPLAALGFMSPVLCAAAMGLSDLIVIGNALRLRRWTLKIQ